MKAIMHQSSNEGGASHSVFQGYAKMPPLAGRSGWQLTSGLPSHDGTDQLQCRQQCSALTGDVGCCIDPDSECQAIDPAAPQQAVTWLESIRHQCQSSIARYRTGTGLKRSGSQHRVAWRTLVMASGHQWLDGPRVLQHGSLAQGMTVQIHVVC